jgi:peptidoglycan/xylan/chitin deacetylase (PgdA/CDA1 family)
MMRALLYHDVAPRAAWPATGFQGGDADVYKLTPEQFEAHLDALGACGRPPVLPDDPGADSRAWTLTFDDGGDSALEVIAPALERRGWRGVFLMTTGRIGTRGFLGEDGLRELVGRGHRVGSHSVSHPLVMSACPPAMLEAEWRDSVDALERLLGARPSIASIPGGAYDASVAAAAERAGIRTLLTSEPVARAWFVGNVRCVGRFTIWQGMSPAAAHSFASGTGWWPARQRAVWEGKKIAKAVLGPTYLLVRKRLLDRGRTLPASAER